MTVKSCRVIPSQPELGPKQIGLTLPRPFAEQERELLRHKLLGAARRRIEEVGVRAMSVADLTRQVGISKGAFYLLYESKDTLVMEVLSDAEAEVRMALQETAADRSGTPAATMTEVVRAMFEAVGRHPVIGLLADPEEGPHIFRMVPPEELAARVADDDRWFADLAEQLKADGVMSVAVDDDALAAIARLSLTVTRDPDLAAHQGLIGMLCESLGAHLAGDGA